MLDASEAHNAALAIAVSVYIAAFERSEPKRAVFDVHN